MPSQERWYGESRRDPSYRRQERGFMDRTGDEVRSWFGDDEAERRRRMDEREERERGEEYRRGWTTSGESRDYPRQGYREGERGYGQSERGYESEQGRGASGAYGGGYGGSSGAGFGGYGGYGSYGGGYERHESDRGYESPRSSGVSRYGRTGGGYEEDRQRMGSQSQSREREGRFAGRGPKGYQRSDDRIREDVCDRLADAPDLDASDMEVSVREGEVTLSGLVRQRGDKRRAEDLIEDVSGVREVHNTLRTRGRESEQDTSVTAGVEQGTSAGAAKRTAAAGGR